MSENKHGLTPYEISLKKAAIEVCKSFDWNADEIIANVKDIFTTNTGDEELYKLSIQLFCSLCNEHNKKSSRQCHQHQREQHAQRKIIIHQNAE